MFGGTYGSSCIFNNMRVGGPDRGGGTGIRAATCAEPISSGGGEVAISLDGFLSNYDEIAHDLDAVVIRRLQCRIPIHLGT